MNLLLLSRNEVTLCLSPAACAELRGVLEKKKRFAAEDGSLPGSIRLTADATDDAEQKHVFTYLHEHSRLQTRARLSEATYLRHLSISMGRGGSWQRQGCEAELQLPPDERQLFCAALGHFVEGYWLFFIELPSCGLLVNFASHGSPEHEKDDMMEDGRF